MNNFEIAQNFCPRFFFDANDTNRPLKIRATSISNPDTNGRIIYYFVTFDNETKYVALELDEKLRHVIAFYFFPHAERSFAIEDEGDIDSILLKGQRARLYIAKETHSIYPVSTVSLSRTEVDSCVTPIARAIPFSIMADSDKPSFHSIIQVPNLKNITLRSVCKYFQN